MSGAILVDETIGGVQYRLVRLPRLVAGQLALQVGRLVAAAAAGSDVVPALIQAARASDDKGAEAVAGVVTVLASDSKIIDALAGGVANLDTDLLYQIGLKCIKGQLHGPAGKMTDDASLEAHFSNYPDHLFLVMAWAIKQNVMGFFVKGVQG